MRVAFLWLGSVLIVLGIILLIYAKKLVRYLFWEARKSSEKALSPALIVRGIIFCVAGITLLILGLMT